MDVNDRPDDGSAEWAAEAAAGMIGRAFYRATKEGEARPREVVLSLTTFARSLLRPADWKAEKEGPLSW